EKGGYTFVRLGPPVSAGKYPVSDLFKLGIVRLGDCVIPIAGAQGLELLDVHSQPHRAAGRAKNRSGQCRWPRQSLASALPITARPCIDIAVAYFPAGKSLAWGSLHVQHRSTSHAINTRRRRQWVLRNGA